MPLACCTAVSLCQPNSQLVQDVPGIRAVSEAAYPSCKRATSSLLVGLLTGLDSAMAVPAALPCVALCQLDAQLVQEVPGSGMTSDAKRRWLCADQA